MNRAHLRYASALAALSLLFVYSGCGTEVGAAGGGANGATGASCKAPVDCYPGVDPATLSGSVACLSVGAGYCTHTCTSDADCCSAKGECPSGHAEVCSPFQSTGAMYCLLSCEASDVGSLDATTYCTDYANAAFTCRSSGGGAKNRKICAP